MINDIIDLVYPRICLGCSSNKPVKTGLFCVECIVELPLTNFHTFRDNPFERHFWGRVEVVFGASYLFFVPGGRTQSLLHHIKYGANQLAAVKVGRDYGLLLEKSFVDRPDVIIPVPLHWRKKHKRGFNQSEEIAKGLSQSLRIPLDTKSLIRTRGTATQTRKSRSARLENISGAFRLDGNTNLHGRHVLLVDDVLTTGATLEACANVILQSPDTRLSMVTIACGRI